jgi:hypothetical protein
MNKLSYKELMDILENGHNESIKYAFLIESKLFEAKLENVTKTKDNLSLSFLKGDVKIVLNSESIILNRFKNQYELVTNGEYIGSLIFDREKHRQ